MGYDMSDSLFMQQQQAAGRDKESKRALEEKTALEAFRAAALQVCPACPTRPLRMAFDDCLLWHSDNLTSLLVDCPVPQEF